MQGLEEIKRLRAAGFGDAEVQKYEQTTRENLAGAGFTPKQVDEYFGHVEPDMGPTKEVIKSNLAAAKEANAGKEVVSTKEYDAADSFMEKMSAGMGLSFDAFKAGLQKSSAGLLLRGKLPDTVLPDDAPRLARIASQIGEVAGDLPAMIVGTVAGAAAGTAVAPGPGTILGGGAGGNALPSNIKSVLMQHYEKGDIKDFGDYWDRFAATLIQTTKDAAIGGTAAATGNLAAPIVKGAAPFVEKGISALSEVATMTVMGKTFEGQVPSADDFIDGAILVGGLTGAGKVAKKLRGTYVEADLKPHEVADKIPDHPTLLPELLSENIDTPKVLEVQKPEVKPAESEVSKVDPNEPKTSTQKILDQVGEKPEKEGFNYDANKFYKDFVDKFDPIKVAQDQLGGKKLPTSENPYQLARMFNDYKARAKHAFERGTLDYNTLEVNGKSFKDIVEPFKEDLGGFSAYLISKRALEIEGRGLKSGFDLEAASDVVKNGKAKYEAAANDVVEFQNRNLKYLLDSGVIDNKAFKAMADAGKAYIPFSRIMDADGNGASGKSSSLKKLTGSERKIQDPLLSMLENTETIYRMAEKNRVLQSFVNLAKNHEGFVEKVDAGMKPVEVNASEVQKMFSEHGIDADPEPFTIFRSNRKQLGPNEFEVINKGKREVYKTTPELAEAFKSLDGDPTNMNVVVKLFKGVTTLKRIGISMTPDFIVKNFFRDQLTAASFSKGEKSGLFTHGAEVVTAMKDIWSQNDAYYNWLKSGGAGGAFIDLNQNYLEKNIYKLDKDVGALDKAWNVIKTPVEFMGVMGSLAEQSTRLAEFKRVSKGATSGTKVMEGGFAAREITVDFQRVGAKTAAFNAITAFQNVGIQGLDRTIRAVKENPGSVAMKAGALITTPSILLWWANHDDPRYQEIPRWQKDLFWIIPTDNWVKAENGEEDGLPEHLIRQGKNGVEVNKGVVFRIPKPQELGIVFGSLPERVLESFFSENPKAYDDFHKTMTELVTPSFIPDAVAPVAEQYANKSFFTGNPIVNAHAEKLLPEYQYNEYTSSTAKALGKLISNIPAVKDIGPDDAKLASPAVIDNYIRSWTGSLGQYALQLADKAVEGTGIQPSPLDATMTLADVPVIKAFVIRHPSASMQSIQDFYSEYNRTEKVFATIKELAKRGELNEMEEVMNVRENREKMVRLESTKQALGNMTQAIHMINQSKEIAPEDKRQLIDKLYYGMSVAAKNSLNVMETVKKDLALEKK